MSWCVSSAFARTRNSPPCDKLLAPSRPAELERNTDLVPRPVAFGSACYRALSRAGAGILRRPRLYLLSQALMGAKRARRLCVEQYAGPRPRLRILDIGCGPGYVVEYFPDPIYVGFDVESKYIEYAENQYGNRGDFYCRPLDADAVTTLEPFDLVLMTGVIHHLNNSEAADLLALSRRALKDRGARLITLDPCYQRGQSRIARFLLDHDRGQHIRTEDAYVELASGIFPRVDSHVRHDLFYVPYTCIVMQCGLR